MYKYFKLGRFKIYPNYCEIRAYFETCAGRLLFSSLVALELVVRDTYKTVKHVQG